MHTSIYHIVISTLTPTPNNRRQSNKASNNAQRSSSPDSLNALLPQLSSVQLGRRHSVGVLVLVARDLVVRNTKDDLDVAGVALVRVDATVRTVSPAAGFLKGKKRE